MKHKVASILLTILIFFLCIIPLHAFSSLAANESTTYTNWPLMRMDSNNSGFTPATLPTTMKFDEFLPVDSLHAAIVANNNYFLIEWGTGELHCYDIDTQDLNWKKLYSESTTHHAVDIRMGNICAFSESTNQLLLLETIAGRWSTKTDFFVRVYAINPSNGNIIWQNDIKGYYANSIMLSDSEAYIKVMEITKEAGGEYVSNKHKIACFDLGNGKSRWISKNIAGGEAYMLPNAVTLHTRYIITTSSKFKDQKASGQLVADSPCYISLLDKKTGEHLNTTVLKGFAVICSPLLVNNKVFVTATKTRFGGLPNHFFCFEITEGNLKFNRSYCLSDEAHHYLFYTNLSKHNDSVYFLDYSGLLVCISTET